ncbi:hypothetical protein KY330_04885 [Candidatus Woesearchaeota archaeon]|nr:hypothetical protein [Candidatus Woesearchaeota archaeon]
MHGPNPNEKIKPLVDILKKVDYIDVEVASDRSYNPGDDFFYNANVRFSVPKDKEGELEKLIEYVCKETNRYWSEVTVEPYKRYWVVPDTDELNSHWVIEFVPFPTVNNEKLRKGYTDKLIGKAITAVKKYLNSKEHN